MAQCIIVPMPILFPHCVEHSIAHSIASVGQLVLFRPKHVQCLPLVVGFLKVVCVSYTVEYCSEWIQVCVTKGTKRDHNFSASVKGFQALKMSVTFYIVWMVLYIFHLVPSGTIVT